jgi:hypothetical protein
MGQYASSKSIGVKFLVLLLWYVLGASLTLTGSERDIIFLAFTPHGVPLSGCSVKHVLSENGSDNPVPNQFISGMNVSSIADGNYRVIYQCGSFIYMDSMVAINGESRVVVLVDRTEGDRVTFAPGTPVGLRISIDLESRGANAHDFGMWVRVAYVIDGEGWTRLVDRTNGVAYMPAKPGYYILSYPRSASSICSHLLMISSWISSLKVGVSERCEVVPLEGVNQVGQFTEHVVLKQTPPE